MHKNSFQIRQALFSIVFTCCFFLNHTPIEANTETDEKSIEVHDRNHVCNVLVISCIDFRFVSFIQTFLTDNLKIKGDYDYIAIPGSVINILKSETQSVTFSEVDISLNLHRVRRLVLIGHKDCGAYGGSKRFESEEKETETLFNDLRRVRDMLKEKHPNLEVDLFIASLRNVDNEKIYYMERVR